MSHLGKLKPSHLYIYDRFAQDKKESDAESKDGMLDEHHPSAELSQDYKIHLKDDGLGKYKISPLGCLNDPTEAVRIFNVCHEINGKVDITSFEQKH